MGAIRVIIQSERTTRKAIGQLLLTGVAVEKLLGEKSAKTKLRQDALQTISLIFQTFGILRILAV